LGSSVNLNDYEIDRQVAHILPEEAVRRLNMLPIRIEADQLHIATTAPLNLPGMDEVRLLTGLRVKPIMVSEKDLAHAINEHFSIRQTAKQAIVDIRLQGLAESVDPAQQEQPDIEEAPVVMLVNSIISGAVSDGASDIHLEPQHPEMRVRYRINGILHDITTIPKHIEPSIVSRVKLMADMDITERRRPQDGHIAMDIEDRQVDLRVSTVLTINGEKIVMRVLDKETMLIELEQLGLSGRQQDIFKSFIARPHGMILITGPTGSGKTTTLYAVLKQLDPLTQNIVTIENPVEYEMPNINQIQVNPYVDMTFAAALRTIVRQDPDIIMVGEIRDFETADIAVQAALTGHLVFSTLHTNDAPGAIVRLLDMGVQPFFTASAVTGVAAQRLVRTICPQCKESYRPSRAELQWLNLPDDVSTLARGKGCNFCLNTGYRGRTGVFEILEIDEGIRQLILAQAPANEIRKMALAEGMESLCEMGREKVLQGISTVEEVQRATYMDF
jgi:type IV pilus assembly protein PilB